MAIAGSGKTGRFVPRAGRGRVMIRSVRGGKQKVNKNFHPFELERMMSEYEQRVEYNLAESGVHPVLLSELLADHPNFIDELLKTDLNYPHVNGIPELRRNIARMYPDAGPGNVLVTVGASEANYLAVRTLLAPGEEIVIMRPNYMQIWGIARNHELRINTFGLREEAGWAPDLDELEAVVSGKTKMIAVCQPNNPTGRILTAAEIDQIVAIAEKYGTWILADEVYRGAERLTDEESPTFFGRYDKTVVTGSMSKAYGLPGLRIGWAVAPEKTVGEIWARHEYVAISAPMLANKLAALALSPEVRPRLINRTREYIRRGFPVLQKWLNKPPGVFSLVPPEASAISFIQYDLEINSTELTNRLITEKSVLIVPGDHFGMDGFVRISFGLPQDYLTGALDRIGDLVAEITETAAAAWPDKGRRPKNNERTRPSPPGLS